MAGPMDGLRSFSTARYAKPKVGEYGGGEYLGMEEIPFSAEQNMEMDTIQNRNATTNATMQADLDQSRQISALRNAGYGLQGGDPRREQAEETFGRELQKAVLPAQATGQRYVDAARVSGQADLGVAEMNNERMRDLAELDSRTRLGVANIGLQGTETEQDTRMAAEWEQTARSLSQLERLNPEQEIQLKRALEGLRSLGWME